MSVFPPVELAEINNAYATHEAWWTGEIANQPKTPEYTHTPGIVERARNLFWGRTTRNETSRADIHIPIASTICETSAQLMYGKPPALTGDAENETATTTRLNQYIENGLFTNLLEGAELGAALGGRYQRVTWDTTRETPFLTTVHPANVIPTFQWGTLTQAIVHTVLAPLKNNENTVYRHLETHYLDENGFGRIRHELYKGSTRELGSVIPLYEHPATRPLADLVDENAEIRDGITPGLNIFYFPNITPNRRFLANPYGKHLGRSDLDQLPPLLDALDEVWNSWLRDVRLGKARLIVPRFMLENRDGVMFHNLDRETYEGVETPGDPGGNNINSVQFNIRHLEHMNTVQELTQEIIHAAGYSTSTFGEQDSVAITATEVRSREKATLATRDRKLRLEQPRLEQALRKMLAVDTAVFDTPDLNPDEVEVKFPDLAVDTPEALARIAAQLAGAGIASTETLVTMLHPDWDAESITAEVERVRAQNATVIDPVSFHPYSGGE